MKKKKFTGMKTIIIALCIIIVFTIGFFTECFNNLWCILTENGFFIPKESNIFIFNATKMNEGSGGRWLYGEDNKYYYGLNIEGGIPQYYKTIKKDKFIGFNKFEYKTWNNIE
ncbi:hypothetical protein FACS1894161_3280 [Spirochaetia bacterium]|nr:hypothetical protein FACS1894161_3280 [Spirochaetia bacterium]